MRHAWPAAVALMLTTGPAASTALPDCLEQLGQQLERLGRPQAGEVASELRELNRRMDRLSAEATRLAAEQEALEEEQARSDRARIELEQSLANIDRQLQAVINDARDLERRIAIHNAEAAQQHAAVGAAQTPAAMASANAWGARITARKTLLDREGAAIMARAQELEAQRIQLTQGSDISAEASRFRSMHVRRERVDQELSLAISQCAALLPRALALSQIANSPARNIDYRAPDEVADRVLRDLADGVGGAVATIFLRNSTSGRNMRRVLFPTVRRLSRLGLTAARFNMAVTVAEIATEALLAGAEQNEREVVRNIYLIGDYARALEVMFRERGAAAAATPEYLAIRGELERLRSEMPGSEAEFLLDSADEPAALIAAFLGIARRYVGGQASRVLGAQVPALPPHARVDARAPVARALDSLSRATLTVPTDVAVGTARDALQREAIAVENRIEHIDDR